MILYYIYTYILWYIYIYIHYVNHQFDFQNCEPPKKEFACSPTLQWWAAPQWSGQGTPWETTSTWWWENHESYVFFCGSLPSSMVSSLPTFLHLYGLYIHSCCQLKPQVVITLSRWKFDFCPQLQFFDSNLTAGPSVCHPRYGPLPVISAYNPIYGMYNPIEMNQFLVIICYNHLYVVFRAITARNIPRATSVTFAQRTLAPF